MEDADFEEELKIVG